MFREKNIDNPPPYDENTVSKINKAIDMDTINKHRAQRLQDIDEKYYKHLNQIIDSLNKYIIDTAIPKDKNNIVNFLIFDSLKRNLGVNCNGICQKYYKRLIDDMLEAYKQYKPVMVDNTDCKINLPNYKYQQGIKFTLW